MVRLSIADVGAQGAQEGPRLAVDELYDQPATGATWAARCANVAAMFYGTCPATFSRGYPGWPYRLATDAGDMATIDEHLQEGTYG